MKKQTKQKISGVWKVLIVIFIIFVLGIIIFYPQKSITCYKSEQETYYENEPYRDTERYCSDRSWWSGDCVSWDYRTITLYKSVERTRTVNTPYSKQVNWLFGNCPS